MFLLVDGGALLKSGPGNKVPGESKRGVQTENCVKESATISVFCGHLSQFLIPCVNWPLNINFVFVYFVVIDRVFRLVTV